MTYLLGYRRENKPNAMDFDSYDLALWKAELYSLFTECIETVQSVQSLHSKRKDENKENRKEVDKTYTL